MSDSSTTPCTPTLDREKGLLFTAVMVYASYIHGFLNMAIGIIVLISNLINTIVFTRKNMWSKGRNVYEVMLGIALVDILTALEYIPYIYTMFLKNLIENTPQKIANEGTVSRRLFHYCFWHVLHTISILLTVVLAVCRYMAVNYPIQFKIWCNQKNTRRVLLAVYILGPVFCVPIFFMYSSNEINLCGTNEHFHTPKSIYAVTIRAITTTMPLVLRVSFLLYVFIIQLMSSAVLAVFSIRLILALKKREKMRRYLGSTALRKEEKIDRKTKMMVVVLILFLISEVPQGLFYILQLKGTFALSSFIAMKLIGETLATCNAGLNFGVYYFMDEKFRKTLCYLVRTKKGSRYATQYTCRYYRDNNINTDGDGTIVLSYRNT